MKYALVFHPASQMEYTEAFIWYEKQQAGLGLQFEEALEERLLQIAQHPEHYSAVKKPYREASINKFPFVIVYKISKQTRSVFISSIFHTSRNPRLKYRKKN